MTPEEKAAVLDALREKSIPEPNSGCWLWLGYTRSNGYGALDFKGFQHQAHRLAWEATHGPIPAGMFACHKCDVRGCVNPDHIFLGTHTENMADMIQKGRWFGGERRGECNARARLTEAAVRQIRADTRSYPEIARDHGVHRNTVGAIKTGERWGHIQ